MLAETMGKDVLGYRYTVADKDIWIKRGVLTDGNEYYSMVLVYIDDILCIHKDTLVVVNALESIYVMKQGIMGPPYRYLGENIEKAQIQDS